MMSSLSAVWNHAGKSDPALPANPVERRLAGEWYEIEPREGHVEAADLPKFYEAVCALDNAVQRDFLTLLLFSGLRRGAAASLRWDNIDPNCGWVDFRAKMIRLPRGANKEKRKFDMPLSDHLLGLLVARRQLGKGKFVFEASSKSGHVEDPKRPLRLVADACGVHVSAHDLRRTFATCCELADVGYVATQALLNHSPVRSVTGGYVQLSEERLRELAQRVADRMKQLCGIVAPAGDNVAVLRG